MIRKDWPSVKPEDLNVGALGLKSWQELTPAQWKDRMEDMQWILDMLYCARILGGLEHLSWEATKDMTFPQYMKAVKDKASTIPVAT
jgi:hypothetical protein